VIRGTAKVESCGEKKPPDAPKGSNGQSSGVRLRKKFAGHNTSPPEQLPYPIKAALRRAAFSMQMDLLDFNL
jgi:hypothetical protein